MLLLLFHIGDVRHVLGNIGVHHVDLLLLLGARWQQGLRRVLSNDDIFLGTAIPALLLLHLLMLLRQSSAAYLPHLVNLLMLML